jgi:hypothetical protein
MCGGERLKVRRIIPHAIMERQAQRARGSDICNAAVFQLHQAFPPVF